MGIIAPQFSRFHVRNLFHEIDTNGNGVIDVDEFLNGIDSASLIATRLNSPVFLAVPLKANAQLAIDGGIPCRLQGRR